MPSPKRDDETQSGYVIRVIQEEERERCLRIIEGFKPRNCWDDKDVLRSDLCDAIAEEIRNQG
jgi:hypothetical protein